MRPIEITKEHVGRAVFAIPTGNNARRGVSQQELVRFEVVGFGRKYAKVLQYGREVAICPRTGALQESIRSGFGNNSGYIFFNSKDDATLYQQDTKMRQEANALLRSYNAISRLSMATVQRIITELSTGGVDA